jgi:hypothetical protein
VNVADRKWRKSSYSGSTGGDCVEVAVDAPQAALRDSKDVHGAVLTVGHPAWREFLRRTKAGSVGRA